MILILSLKLVKLLRTSARLCFFLVMAQVDKIKRIKPKLAFLSLLANASSVLWTGLDLQLWYPRRAGYLYIMTTIMLFFSVKCLNYLATGGSYSGRGKTSPLRGRRPYQYP